VPLIIKLLQMKKAHLLTLIALIMLGLSGCEKAKVANEATADVYVKAIKNAQGVTVYAAIHSVFSYNVMKSVGVTSPGGATLQLTNYENGGNSFFNEPAVTEYSTTPPTAGAYTYLVKFNDGEEITYTNSLQSSAILPANITSLVKTTAGDSVYVAWDAIAGTHGYQLKVMNGTTQVYYSDPFSDPSSPLKANLRLGFPLSKLTSNITGTYTFYVTGLLYETTAYVYIQAISISQKDIAL
jgi:hypothetical protein